MKKVLVASICGLLSLYIGGLTYAIGDIRVLPGRVTQYATSSGSQVWHYQIPKITVIKPASFDIIFKGQ